MDSRHFETVISGHKNVAALKTFKKTLLVIIFLSKKTLLVHIGNVYFQQSKFYIAIY